MAVKCKIKMGDNVLPVPGSVQGTGIRVTGTCPECETPGVMLSIVGGYVRAHVIAQRAVPENNPQPPTLVEKAPKTGKGLREPVTDLTDTGVRVGDPRAAEQRRVVELHGIQGNGTVAIPVKGESGRTKLTPAPATEENLRKALAYWKGRKPRTQEARQKQAEMLTSLFRWLAALHTDTSVLDARSTDAASAHRGPTLVPGRDTPPRLRDPELPFTEPTDLRRNGEVRKSTTLDQPRGRDRFDRKITNVPEPPRKRTAAERRRYRRAHQALGK